MTSTPSTPTRPGLRATLDRLRGDTRRASSISVVVISAVILLLGVTRSADLASNLTLWMTSALLALSLQFIWGNAGILSFAQGVFFGVGAYVYGIVSINLGVVGSTLLWAIPAGIVAAALAAALGYFIFYGKLSDIAVAIITYAFTLVFAALSVGVVFKAGAASVGGANGKIGIFPHAFGSPQSYTVADTTTGFVVTLIITAVIWFGLVRLRSARYGRVLDSIRQNDERSTLLGYDVRVFKLSSFSLAGGIAGVAGALFAAWSQFVNPGQFSAQTATFVVIWVLVGGRRSPVGCVIGAILISAVQFYFGAGDFSQYVTLILGALAVAIILIAPDGVAALAARAVAAVVNRVAPRGDGASSPDAASESVVDDGPDPRSFAPPAPDPDADPTPLLEVREVSKAYGGVKAVSGVDLTVGRAEIKCIIGPNGAGKSTLFGLLSGRTRLDGGTIAFDGHDISSLPSFARARRGIGIKLQTASFFPELTVRDNIDLAARTESAAGRSELVERCIAEVGLAGAEATEAYSLSHGQQQWLEIGMVLAQQPKLILLDEPVAGMTVGERRETVRMIRRLARTCGVIVVEHDMSVVEELGGEVIVMHEGRVLRTGLIQELRHDDAVLDAYLGREDPDPVTSSVATKGGRK